MPRVLHIVYNLIRGGTEGQCARVVLEMARQGAPHHVAASCREGFFLDAIEAACGPVYEMGIHKMVSFGTLCHVVRLAAYLRREKIELVHAWDADAAIFGSLAARWAGLPYITSRRDLGEIYPAYKLRLMRRADRGARAVVVNAEAIRRRLLASSPVPACIRLIPNAVDLDEFDRLYAGVFSLRHRLPPGPLIGMVTRLDPEKDPRLFVRAAAPIAARFPQAGFVVGGDGPERFPMEQLALELGLKKRMVFLGDVREVPALIKHLAVGVLVPQKNEGLSNSILEYMAGRLPVVATRCGGNEELVRPGETGFLVEPGDAEGLAGAVITLLEDPALRRACGERGRRQVEKEHRPAAIARQFAQLYDEVLLS